MKYFHSSVRRNSVLCLLACSNKIVILSFTPIYIFFVMYVNRNFGALKWLITSLIVGVRFSVEAGFCCHGVQRRRLSKIIHDWRLLRPVQVERTVNLTTYLHLASQLRLHEGLPLPWRCSGFCAAVTDCTDVI